LDLAAMQYVQDYDEKFPQHGTKCAGNNDNVCQLYKLDPYIKNTQIRRCPSSATAQYAWNITGNFGLNSMGVALADIDAPATQVLLGESERSTAPVFRWQVPGSCATIDGASHKGCVSARHNEGGNIGFADGHCKWFSVQSIVGPSDSGAIQWVP